MTLEEFRHPIPEHLVLYRDQHVLVIDKPNRFLLPKDVGSTAGWTPANALDFDVSGTLLLTRGHIDLPSIRVRFAIGVTRNPPVDSVELRGALTWHVQRRVGGRIVLDATAAGQPRSVRSTLAALGCPIAGDHERRGEPAQRLMLHAHQVEWVDPETQLLRRVPSPLPLPFRRWVDPGDGGVDGIAKTVLDAATRRRGLFQDESNTAFRLLHGEAEGLDGIDVELFGNHAVVWVHEHLSRSEREIVLDVVHSLGVLGVYLKIRPKLSSRSGQRDDLCLSTAVRGESLPDNEMIVCEGPLRYLARLGSGQQTGLFLDQRLNRRWVLENATGKRVLNLFSYTCSFSVAAAVGGAERTVSVDISPSVLETGLANLKLNGQEGERHSLVRADVMDWLRGVKDDFDIVVLDPPTYSTTKRGRFSVEQDFVRAASACIRRLRPGGTLLACTNHRRVSEKRVVQWLQQATQVADRSLTALRVAKPPPDFPSAGERMHLKTAYLQVR